MQQDTRLPGDHVLVVDDDPTILDLIAEFLEDEGYTVRRACNGFEAWQAIEAARPLLLITDIRMPRMSGSELVARVRACGYDFPILVVAATPALATPLLQLNDTAFIAKPFELDQLFDGVRRFALPATLPLSLAG
jgi:DNA-binding response OmpR family regulator